LRGHFCMRSSPYNWRPVRVGSLACGRLPARQQVSPLLPPFCLAFNAGTPTGDRGDYTYWMPALPLYSAHHRSTRPRSSISRASIWLFRSWQKRHARCPRVLYEQSGHQLSGQTNLICLAWASLDATPFEVCGSHHSQDNASRLCNLPKSGAR